MKKPPLLQRLRQKKLLQRAQERGTTAAPQFGVTWYTAESWAQIKETALDPERFEESFAEWEEMAERALADLRAAGAQAIRFPIDPDRFAAWCAEKGRENDAEGRSTYASYLLGRLYGEEG